jgi:hypothetical protein
MKNKLSFSAFELLKMYFEVSKNQVICGFYSTNVDNIYFMLNLKNNLGFINETSSNSIYDPVH